MYVCAFIHVGATFYFPFSLKFISLALAMVATLLRH